MNRVFFGDCRDTMRTLIADGVRVQMCVTSPPYFNLRDYQHPGQIGLEKTPAEFVAAMVEVFGLVHQLLADDGVLFLNLGDSYFGSSQTGGTKSKEGSAKRAGRMFRAATASVQHASLCGTSDKAPANSPARDCLCGNLCGACQRAYRIGKSRTDVLRDPMLSVSSRASSHARMESQPARLPTSGCLRPADHSVGANLDLQTSQAPGRAPLPCAQASTTDESCLQPQGDFPQSAQSSECQLCGCSFDRCAQESADSLACTCGTESLLGPSNRGTSGRSCSGLAYPDLTTNALKPKDLIGIPWRVAFALQEAGWYLRQDIIWHKPNPMPESVTDRCTKAHEYLFLLAKSERYFWDAQAMKEPAVYSGLTGQDASGFKNAANFNGKHAANPDVRGEQRSKRDSFKRDDSKRAEVIPGQTVGTHRTDREESDWDTGMRNRRSVWTVPTVPYSGAHFATFPPALIEPCILAGSRTGDVVLDPFGGSGTTAQVAQALGRKWILCELNPEYEPLQRARTAQAALALPPITEH